MLLIVGLGNPDAGYAQNRHNIGFRVVDHLAERLDADPFRSKFSGRLSRCSLKNDDALLLKPQTYMNLSGDSVQPCAAYFKIPATDVVVIHDELDLPFGDVRLKRGGGHGGNNGVRSIIQRLGPDFMRVRFGIGRPPASFRGDVADYVLSDFSKAEAEELPKLVALAAKSVLDIATRGFAAAMKTRNTRPKQKKPPAETGDAAAPAAAEPTNSADSSTE